MSIFLYPRTTHQPHSFLSQSSAATTFRQHYQLASSPTPPSELRSDVPRLGPLPMTTSAGCAIVMYVRTARPPPPTKGAVFGRAAGGSIVGCDYAPAAIVAAFRLSDCRGRVSRRGEAVASGWKRGRRVAYGWSVDCVDDASDALRRRFYMALALAVAGREAVVALCACCARIARHCFLDP